MEDATKQNDVQPLKRKAGSNSPLPEEEAKRSKVDEDVVPDQPRNGSRKADKSESSKDEQAQRATQSPLDRRKSISQEEKKRGQRLFGSLLSTLSQTTTNSQQKRRKEIEKRQQGRAQTQRIEEDKHRSGDSVKLQNAREISQLELDEKVMNARHSNMLAMARNLRTRTEPRLYYLPCELTREQDATIKRQVEAAKKEIEKEKETFQRQKQRRLAELGARSDESPRPASTDGVASNQKTNHPPSLSEDRESAESADKRPAPTTALTQQANEMVDESGDVMIEAVEETLIY